MFDSETFDPVEFVIPGKPMTWTRTRVGKGHGGFFVPEERKSQMGEIRNAWFALGAERIEAGDYVRLSVVCFFDRPSGHFGTGRNAGVLKESARDLRPGLGKNGGDLDNLVKLVKDALNSVAFRDDSQIAEYGEVAKVYCDPGERPCTWVRLEPAGRRRMASPLRAEAEPLPEQGTLVAA